MSALSLLLGVGRYSVDEQGYVALQQCTFGQVSVHSLNANQLRTKESAINCRGVTYPLRIRFTASTVVVSIDLPGFIKGQQP